LIDQAISPLVLPEEEAAAACAAFFEQQQIDDPEARQRWLQQTGLNELQLLGLATRSVRLQHFKEQQWGTVIESDFLTNKTQLDQVAYSLLRTSQPEVAQELYFRISSGEQDFAELAQEYSEGPEAKTGGKIGPVPLLQSHPALIERLRQGKVGQIFPPIQIDQWYVLLRLDQRISAQLDEPTRQQLLEHRFEAWLKQQMSAPQPKAPANPEPQSTRISTLISQP
jgi:parvulin-like peptidyl-prolyl isomerase